MSCIRILPVIALFLIQYTIQSELDRDDDLAMIVVKPPALRTNDYVTVDAVYPTMEALRNRKKTNKRGRRPTHKNLPRHQNQNNLPDTPSIPDDTVVVLLFSNHIVDNMSGGYINFAGTTSVDVKQTDQSKKLSYGGEGKATKVANVIGLIQKLFSQ
ncbi:uncharacterized protein LOC133319764 [Danaus plexippus]|uniref:uncharacterized protein LOC133319764 n=1 Tax=Danaus plexippus TaxID=13037 RepID=UPI002AB06A5B|nr:uncharacterized protein LOC133319764 [Danaus plexippus]